MRDFVVPPTVHVTLDEHGGMVVLNTHTGRWHVLNRTGGVAFEELRRTGDLECALSALEERFPSVLAGEIRADVDRLVTALVERDLLRLARHAGGVPIALTESASPAITWRSRVVTMLCLFAAVVLLRLPLRVPIALVRRLKARKVVRPASVAEGIAVLDAVHAVSRGFPGRVACMELSLTAVLVAAVEGRALDWCFGHSSDPVTFHSWVETEGTPVRHPDDEPVTPTYRRVLAV
ncbi:hypothetical protein Lesp02_12400 [Lentzea sp. NBRC 105346]|uniref:lasso peptide biosynthesis B2 protein n=1 Tax=Lentzea sp. NBRC 105346 TaxID=3032205 RepID=UPI0024A19BBB|nr:lasso peptide biosynthesis B2 protein [Lentzea sp. NBRC 105346]GLZ29050.1 hypothetical protein Lesp02_12400 [Lentzea sp. NBRC 105346]